MFKILLLSLSTQYTVDGQYIPSLFIEPKVRHDKTSYTQLRTCVMKIVHIQGKSPNVDMGAQWLSGRVLDLRPKGRGFKPHRGHCVVVLEQDTFILA